MKRGGIHSVHAGLHARRSLDSTNGLLKERKYVDFWQPLVVKCTRCFEETLPFQLLWVIILQHLRHSGPWPIHPLAESWLLYDVRLVAVAECKAPRQIFSPSRHSWVDAVNQLGNSAHLGVTETIHLSSFIFHSPLSLISPSMVSMMLFPSLHRNIPCNLIDESRVVEQIPSALVDVSKVDCLLPCRLIVTPIFHGAFCWVNVENFFSSFLI